MSKLKTEYAELSDIKLAFTRYGNGPILILLHGNSMSKKMFKSYQEKHFLEYETIAIDSRGHGKSISIDDEYSIKQYSEDITNFCELKGIKEAFLIGYSDGGNIALFLAKKASHIFKKVIAISPNYLVEGTEEKTLKMFKRIMKIFYFLQKLGFNMKKNIMRFNLMLNDIGLTEDDLKTINANIKIIYAEKDMIKEDHIKHISELIPNSTLKKINNCTHLSIFYNLETIKEIKEFLC